MSNIRIKLREQLINEQVKQLFKEANDDLTQWNFKKKNIFIKINNDNEKS